MLPDLSGQKTADLFQTGRSCSPHLLQGWPILMMAKHRRHSNFKVNLKKQKLIGSGVFSSIMLFTFSAMCLDFLTLKSLCNITFLLNAFLGHFLMAECAWNKKIVFKYSPYIVWLEQSNQHKNEESLQKEIKIKISLNLNFPSDSA